MDKQFDVTEEQKRVIQEKAQRRAVLRNEFLKLRTNPFLHATGDSGVVFDPAIHRFDALKVSGFDYFKTTGKNVLYGMVFMILPMVAYGLLVKTKRDEREAQYRRGEIAYKDRLSKFI